MKKSLLLVFLLLTAFVSQGLNLLTESFDGTTFPPAGWTRIAGGSLTWSRITAGSFPSQSPHSGAGEAQLNSFSVSSGSAELITPSVSFVGASGIIVSFWMYRDNGYLTTADRVEVYVNTSGTSAGGTLLGTVNRSINLAPTVTSNGWYFYSFTVPSTFNSGTNYIIFKGTSVYGNDCHIDDVAIDNPICGGTPLQPTISTAAVPLATPVCIGGTMALTAVDPNQPVSGMTYQWQVGATSTGPWSNVTNGSGGTTVNYTTGPISANTYYRIAATCVNSSITVYSAAYFVPVGAPQPGAFSGPTTACPGDPATFSVPAVSGTTYTWTLPPGWSGFSTSNSIVVTPGPITAAVTISVTATSACGTSIAQTRTVVPGSAPAPPGAISGNNNICFGTTQNYSITAVGGASSYIWTLPSGWTGTSTTNSITATANNTGGNVTVKAINGCGQSSVTSLPVVVINSLANPGTITGKDTVCSGTLQAYSIAAVPGATSYTWTLPSGWSGTTTGTTIQAFAGSSAGGISVTAYVSCATSSVSSKNIAVTTTVNPAVSISAPTSVLCQGTPVTIIATPSFPGTAAVYQWKKNGVNVAAFGTNYTTNSLVKGDSISVTMTSNAACAANPTATSNTLAPNITPSVMPGVSINTLPPINICKGIPVTFTTTSNGSGATPSYQWYKNGAMIPAAINTTYTDATLSNADTLTIQMTTSAVCAIIPVATSNKVGIRVDDPATPTVSISASPSEYVAPGQPVTFTATNTNGGATPDYQWQKNGVNIPFEINDTYTSSTLKAGDNITVKMLSYADCVTPGLVTSNIVVMKSSLGVGGSQQGAGTVSIYPNPNSGRFTVAASSWDAAYSGKQVRVDVLSAVGQSVYHMELIPSAANWQTQVSLGNDLANGRYMLRISTEDGAVRTVLPFILSR